MSKHTTPDGVERGLGCLVPKSFPTSFVPFADAPGVTILTMDQIRAKLADFKAVNYYNRRTVFSKKWISNQHSTSACNGHSCARALSKSLYIRSGVETLLSGADAYSQMNGGQDNGSTLADGMTIIQRNGVSTEALVPWDHIYSSQISAEAKAVRSRYKGFELYAADDEAQFATGIFYGFVGVVAVHVAGGYDRQDGDGVCQGGNGPGNHSVGIDDIGILSDGRIVYDQFNSWGPEWGQDGRTRLVWSQHLATTVKYHRFFLLRSGLDDPEGNNPPASAS